MIIRCRDDLYNGHWCPVCGVCKCVAKNSFGSSEWAKKPQSTCPLHGKNHKHGNCKLIAWDFDQNGKGRPTVDDGWGDPAVGVRTW